MRQLLQRLAISAALPLLFMLAWAHPSASAEGTVITMSITEDTVFTKAGSPYYIQSLMEIGKNATLTIEPGGVNWQAGVGQRTIRLRQSEVAWYGRRAN